MNCGFAAVVACTVVFDGGLAVALAIELYDVAAKHEVANVCLTFVDDAVIAETVENVMLAVALAAVHAIVAVVVMVVFVAAIILHRFLLTQHWPDRLPTFSNILF